MVESEVHRRARATALFKLAAKASSNGVHRTLNRPPKGKGWVQAANSPAGLMCRPAKVREAIELFTKAYEEFPDIVALNQIALAYEMLGEFEAAGRHFTKMRAQAESEGNLAYRQAAELGLARIIRE
jgi:tetratricopeptide (TPR) repeat protein